MVVVLLIVFLSGFYPLIRAWWANRHTSLFQALNWALTAWLAWVFTLLLADTDGTAARVDPARYLALCLTGCAAVAVLGARRPHVGAWNFVVLGLLAVMVLPLVEGLLAGVPSLDLLRMFFLGATLTVGFLNYLPTRLAPAVLLATLGCSGEMGLLAAPDMFARQSAVSMLAPLLLGFSPWVGWISWKRQTPAEHEIDRLWLDFRNRYGLFWGQRLREQFNAAALNGGWPVYLAWLGLRRLVVSGPQTVKPEEILATMRALLKRFLPPAE
jgi:hypothetical protein